MRLFTDVSSEVDDPYLARACELAQQAVGATAPNPSVGCVIVRDDSVVGEGYHPRAGEPHAEVFALAAAGDAARGADAYVTLEPCAHHGRTPPCADALIAAGISRVFIGLPDPSPEAQGGAEKLRAAGIQVQFAENPAPFRELVEGWLTRVRTGRPFVVAKLGLTLDGHLGFDPAARAQITGFHGRTVTRRLRTRADAVVVGAATVMSDDPVLTLRDADGHLAEHQPLRVVVARTQLPGVDAQVFTDCSAPTLLLVPDAVSHDGLSQLPPHVLVERYDGSEGLAGVFDLLGKRGLNEVLVEPGPRLFTSLVGEGVINTLVTVTAGGFAGADAPAMFEGEADRIGDALAGGWVPVEAGVQGDVSVTTWRRADADRDR